MAALVNLVNQAKASRSSFFRLIHVVFCESTFDVLQMLVCSNFMHEVKQYPNLCRGGMIYCDITVTPACHIFRILVFYIMSDTGTSPCSV